MKHFTVLIVLLFNGLNLFAQSQNLALKKEVAQIPTPDIKYKFIPNQNQWHESILYRATIPNGGLLMRQNSIIYSFLDPVATTHRHGDVVAASTQASRSENETHEEHAAHHDTHTVAAAESKVKGHGIEVEFLGANPHTFIVPDGENAERYNYFMGSDASKWASNLKSYNNLTYKHLYKGVDMRFYTDNKNLKYEFKVAPKTNINQIQLKYKGATHLSLDAEGNLKIGTSILDFIEQKPYCYQIIDGQKIEVKSKFVLQDSTISFQLEAYSLAHELIIDPELIFSSYSGSDEDNYGMTATYDNEGNLYAGGTVFGTTSIITVGAFDTTFGFGSTDVLLLKFNPTGTNLLYATYLGGSGGDSPNSLIVNSQGNLVVMANTSSTNYPTTAGVYDPTHNGSSDIAVTILNAAGSQVLASTYVGGLGVDGYASALSPNYGDQLRGEVDLDANDNVYIASVTNSLNFPTVNGGVGAAALGLQDGVVFRLSANLSSLQWSTYLGGSSDDLAYSVDVSTTNEVFVAGTTNSSNFQTTPTAAMPTYRGNTDGFIRRYSPTGTLLSSTFVGSLSGDVDHLYMMDIDGDNNIYVFGNSRGNHPITAGTYNNTANSGHFLYKFNTALTNVLWSTKLGSPSSSSALSPTAFMVSNCGTIFLSGWGRQVNTFPTTPDALNTTAQANTFYLAMYGKDCTTLEYATFFGSISGFNHVDGGTSRFSKEGIVYQSMCINYGLPTTPGAWRSSGGASWNNAVFKMNINTLQADFTPVDAVTGVPLVSPIVCFPITVKLRNDSRGGTTYRWNLGVFGTSTAFEPVFTITQEGVYPVTLTINNGNCDATVTKSITVTTANLVTNNQTICIGTSAQLQAIGGTIYQWTPTTGLSNPNIANPVARPRTTTTYTVRIVNGTCVKTATTTVTVQPKVPTDFSVTLENDPCYSFPTVRITNNTPNNPQYSYLWTITDRTAITTRDVAPFRFTSAGTKSIRLRVIDNLNNGCDSTITKTVIIPAAAPNTINPNVNSPLSVCEGNSVTLNASGGNTYVWSPTTNLSNPNIANPVASPTETTTYRVRISNSISGCFKDTAVVVNVLPAVNPNFTFASTSCGTSIVVNFTNTSVHRAGTTYLWDFGNGQTSTLQNPPPITYPSGGYYFISLTTNAGTSCARFNQNFYLLSAVSGGFATTISPTQKICETQSTQLLATGGTSYTWSPATGLSATNIANPIANPSVTTTYSVVIRNGECEKTETVLVEVVPKPTPNFTVDLSELCAATPLVTLNNTSIAVSGATYLWDFGNGQTSTNRVPAPFRYATPGNYTITLTVRNAALCENTITKPVTIIAGTNSLITTISPTQRICETKTAQLVATGGLTYTWTPATGLSATNIANPIANPSATTTYSVVISDGICQKTETVTVEILPQPDANFTFSLQDACSATPSVRFTNTSNNVAGTTYSWDFGNGQTSTLQNPPVINYTSGNYMVTLKVVTPNTCEKIISKTVMIPLLTPRLSATSTDICLGSSTVLLASGGNTYSWTPTTGLNNPNISNPIANPTQTTTYRVRISNSITGCFQDMPITITVTPIVTPTFDFHVQSDCGTNSIVSFVNTSDNQPGTTYFWDFGNGETSTLRNPPSVTYLPGEYFVTLVINSSTPCGRSVQQRIVIPPVATTFNTSISPLQRICETQTAQLLATGGTSYTWSPATGLSATNIANPIASPSVSTTYSVVIRNGACQKTETVRVEISPRPTASFTVSTMESCIGLPLVTVTNTSPVEVGTSYFWNFGNGQTSTARNPASFTYAATGTYTITLMARNATGCETITTNTVTIERGNAVISTITPSQSLCETQSIQLLATGGTSYTWSPATGLSATNIANPIASPLVTTTYSVVISNGICQKTETVTISLTQRPIANFSFSLSELCAEAPLVTLNNTSVANTGATYSWNFGNGQTSTERNPAAFRYAAAGTYTITLRVRNTNGCESVATQVVNIVIGNGTFATTISPAQSVCETQNVQLVATGGTSYTWSPATGLSATNIANPIASPSVTTTYSVVIMNGTCRKTETVTVQVNQKPVASFTNAVSDLCAASPLVTLTNTSTAATGATYAWDFGNGQTSTERNPTAIRYAAAGNYTITLRVRNTNGCESVATQVVNVVIGGGTFTSTITPAQTICETQNVQLVATGGTSYAWSPATGLSATNIANPIANPSVTTTYSVVITNGTCQKTETVTVEVTPKPVASFTNAVSELCATAPLVTLTNTSTAAAGATYLWNFGNGETSTSQTPAPFRYAAAGNYNITLRVRNTNGCESTVTQSVNIVFNSITATISLAQTICETQNVQLVATGGTSYAWSPATGLSAANIANPIASPSVTTTYSVVISNGACQKTETVTVTVIPKVGGDFAANLSELCSAMPLVTISNNTVAPTGATYLWNFGNGQTSTEQNPAPFRYAAAGNYTITLTVRKPDGCETIITKSANIIIGGVGSLVTTISPTQRICRAQSTQLLVTGGTSYEWTPTTGLSAANIANPIASPSVSTTYTVRIVEGTCQKTETVRVEVLAEPIADFSLQTLDSCAALPRVVVRNLSTNADRFLWDFGNGITSTEANPTINYTRAGNYVVQLSAYNGLSCFTVVRKNVEIRQNSGSNIQASVLPFNPICQGDSVQLQASGGSRYVWSPATGLSNPNIANPKASPSQTTTYTLSVLNQFNCRRDTSITVQVFPSITTNFDVSLTDNCARFPLVRLRNLSLPLNNVQFFWDFGNGQTSTSQTPQPFRYEKEGVYVIRLRISNVGCTVEKTYRLDYKENIEGDFDRKISISKNTKICLGDSTQLVATGGTSYQWSPSIGLSASNIGNPIAFPRNTTLYTVRISNATGCYRDTTVLISVTPKLQLDFDVALSANCDEEFPLVRIIPDLQNGETYYWTFGNDSSYVGEKPPVFRYKKAGNYVIKVRGVNQSCTKEYSKTIKIDRNDVDFAKNIQILPQNPTVCRGESIQLQVTGGLKYLWSPSIGVSNTTIANPIFKPTMTTKYTVRIFNNTNCYVDSAVTVVVIEEVKADFELKISSECGKQGVVSFVNKSTGEGEHKWILSNGVEIKDKNPKAYNFEKSGEYEIILEVFNGICRKTKSQKILVESVLPPNVITPNGDGKNDKFVIDILQKGWKLEVYDRYGAVMFKTDNYQNDWGSGMDSGLYYYLLISPEGKSCKGWVQVLK